MKRCLTVVLILTLLGNLNLSAQIFTHGADPGHLKWWTLETPHYKLLFPDGLDSLARSYGYQLEQLREATGRSIGMTPGKYLNRVRIENASLLLRQGGHSVQFVSEACGFTNANYFARVFRTAVGMNPAEYARRHSSVANRPHDEDLYVL